MTPERDERREQLIDDVVQRLIMGEKIRYITDSGASKSVTMGDLLIKEVEDDNDGFKDFMSEVHTLLICNSPKFDSEDQKNRVQTKMIADQCERTARPWVEDYIEEIERAVIDEAADEDARRRFEDRQQSLNGGL